MNATEVVGPAGDEDFDAFAQRVRGDLLRALVAVFGPDVGREAALDALAWGWEHWGRVGRMANPAGYLYRVGVTAGKRLVRRGDRDVLIAEVHVAGVQEDRVEDADLGRALLRLSDRQRSSVVLVVGHGLSLREAAETLGCSVSSVRSHVERGLRHLRVELGDDHDR